MEPGPQTSVQTARGRPGWQHLGIPTGGAADPWSARLANRLVGNTDDASLLEATLSGPILRFDQAALVAITGAEWDATLDGLPFLPHQARQVRAGAQLRVGTGLCARAYVAIGGLTVREVLGSAATDLRTGFGGHEGRALRTGDVLRLAAHHAQPMRWRGRRDGSRAIRLVPGPHAELVELGGTSWRASDAADRTGVRIDGHLLKLSDGPSEIPSMGVPLGAVQVPPDGRPIVILADGPVTGGYPVPACVIRADIGRVAQLRPGDELRFVSVSLDEAVEALTTAEASLDDLEPFSLTGEDELGWAGSLG